MPRRLTRVLALQTARKTMEKGVQTMEEDDDGNADRWHYYCLRHCLFHILRWSSAPSVVLRTLIEARGTVAAALGSRCDGNFLYILTGNKLNVVGNI